VSETAADGLSTAEPHRTHQFWRLGRTGAREWWRSLIVIISIVAGAEFVARAVFWAADRISVDALDSTSVGYFLWIGYSAEDRLIGLAAILLASAGLLPIILVLVRWIHRRPLRTLINAQRLPRVGLAFVSLIIAIGAIALAYGVVGYLTPDSFYKTQDAPSIWPYVPLVAVLLPLQVLVEELFFRGYLLQSVGLVSRLVGVRVGVTAALFALLHVWNIEVEKAGMFGLVHYAVFGIYLAILAEWHNGIESAFGFHLGINLFVLFGVMPSASTIRAPAQYLFLHFSGWEGLLFFPVVCCAHAAMVALLPRGRRSIGRGQSNAAT
jgi:membrane protease YdiL (CAAX protease family)